MTAAAESASLLDITAKPSQQELDALLHKIQRDEVRYLLVQFVDIHGSAKVKMVPSNYAKDVYFSGAGFAGGRGVGSGQNASSPDMFCRIDPNSYTMIPYQPGIARIAGDIFVNKQPHPYCARANLKRMLDKFRSMGFMFYAGMEPEFFLVKRQDDGSIRVADDLGVDTLNKACYDYKGISQMLPVLTEINECMLSLGWGNYQTDHEDANGQYEINYDYSDGLTTADRHTFIKMMISQLALKHGCIATFMPKPFGDRTGSGAHLHFSVTDLAGKNVFASSSGDPRGLGQSKLAYNFIGGVLKHARALCLVTNPTVNCYKRLQIGSALMGNRSGFTWTPAFISYGDNNRTQMIRTPGPGRFEDRSLSAANNPYLAFAAYIAAGIDGIVNELDPGDPMTGKNLYDMDPHKRAEMKTLPQTLLEAVEEFEKDEVIREALGPIADELITLKRAEWKEYHSRVSQWEIDKYLTFF